LVILFGSDAVAGVEEACSLEPASEEVAVIAAG
jgi:hypothetical protein